MQSGGKSVIRRGSYCQANKFLRGRKSHDFASKRERSLEFPPAAVEHIEGSPVLPTSELQEPTTTDTGHHIEGQAELPSNDLQVPITTGTRRHPLPLSVGYEERSKDGTVWQVIEPGMAAGRRGLKNVLRETPGPTSYAKQISIEAVFSVLGV